MPIFDRDAVHFEAKDVGWQALSPTIACVCLSTLVVALRWYTRAKVVGVVGVDDCMILLSLTLAWAMCVVIGFAVHAGVGQDGPSGMQRIIQVSKLIVVNNNLWATAVNVTKASILLQYLRIFHGQLTRTLCYGLLSCLLPALLWAVLGGTLLCSPPSRLWNPSVSGTCMSAQRYWFSVAVTDIGLDFIILILPLPAISSLQLPRRQKISLVMVFTLGFFVCAVSIVRLAAVLVASEKGDLVESGVWAIIWSVVEANVGITCACLLALRPLLTSCWPGLMDETGLPKHCMRIRQISDAATLVNPGSSMVHKTSSRAERNRATSAQLCQSAA